MTEVARKALRSVTHFFTLDGWSGSNTSITVAKPATPATDVHRIGEYYVDYSPVTPEEVKAVNAEADEFLKDCKPVS